MCGEKMYPLFTKAEVKGSPPRVRGKAYSKVKPDEYMGITPACAGKRKFFCVFPNDTQDHPRVCGEKGKLLVK